MLITTTTNRKEDAGRKATVVLQPNIYANPTEKYGPDDTCSGVSRIEFGYEIDRRAKNFGKSGLFILPAFEKFAGPANYRQHDRREGQRTAKNQTFWRI
jgi:hypothetical protein